MVPASDPVSIQLRANRRLRQLRSGRYVARDELVAAIMLDAGTGADTTIPSHRPTEH